MILASGYTHLSNNHKEPPWVDTMEWLSQNVHHRYSLDILHLPWDHWTTILGTYFHALALHIYRCLKKEVKLKIIK